ncbi:FIG053235: Diacylglucosamine hydrolase like [hydrothermal vent metagenome]|uniref:FIG053235: Diacylglucosamine hydrolase like n=1 Tax=hydrothermal vent metagenome TaxID=652676 RepID=A0A3B1CMA4_9ZZZZ
MSRMLLHICCGPCAPYVVEQLKKEYEVTLYFYNPNIHPKKEYERRLVEAHRLAQDSDLPFIEEKYDPDNWHTATKGLENEPEKGKRCEVCFDIRLSKTADTAARNGFDVFAAVLSVSPHKDAVMINRVGASAGEHSGVKFLEANWKKKEGFKITTRMADDMGFYRQNYCGCVFSLRDRDKRETEKRNV